jgi:hypothetical protein
MTSLHRVVGLYLFVLGVFAFGITLRRRQGRSKEPPSHGLFKLTDRLAEPRPFGLTLLIISPLPLSYGGITGFLVFVLVYLSSVMAMRPPTEELAQMAVALRTPTSSPRAHRSA